VLFSEPPAVIRDGQPYALPDPIDEGAVTPPDTVYTPYVSTDAISDDGSTIAGSVIISDTPERITHAIHPVIWRC
jgi:hypothetical protein